MTSMRAGCTRFSWQVGAASSTSLKWLRGFALNGGGAAYGHFSLVYRGLECKLLP